MAKDIGEIRVIKKKKSHGGHHGGAWKVAYADFVTAMMAFFLVMWIVGLSQNVKQAVSGYFKDPIGFMEGVRSGNAPFTVQEGDSGGAGEQSDIVNADEERRVLGEAKKAIEKVVMGTPEFRSLKNNVQVSMVNEGLKIELVDGGKSLFFDSASASVKPATRQLLARVARELRALPNSVIIEGHTDNRRLARKDGYSNWDLSADRANSARRVMESAGLTGKQVAQVRGCADTQPHDGSDPSDPRNRRVSIIVAMKGKLIDGPAPPVAAPVHKSGH